MIIALLSLSHNVVYTKIKQASQINNNCHSGPDPVFLDIKQRCCLWATVQWKRHYFDLVQRLV